MESQTDFYLKKFPDNRHEGKTKVRQAQLVMLRMLKIIDHICEKHNISYWLEAGTLLGAVRHKGFIPWDDDLDISMFRDDLEKFRRVAQDELPENMMMQAEMPSDQDYKSHRTDKGFFSAHVPIKIRDKESLIIRQSEVVGENFNQGIFVDIFSYDNKSSNKVVRKLADVVARKILKMKVTKLPKIAKRKVRTRYKIMASLFSVSGLNRTQRAMIKFFNRKPTKYVGYGYDFYDEGHFPKDSIFPLKRIAFEDTEFLVPRDPHTILTIKFGDYMKMPPEEDRKTHHRFLEPIKTERTLDEARAASG